MYDSNVHSVKERIVSIRQPWIRPIVRGKEKSPVEFGAKFDLSLDGKAMPGKKGFRLKHTMKAVERFRERTGHYPVRVLAGQIYRTRENRSYCKEHGIRLSGPKLGKSGKTVRVDRNIRIILTGLKWNVHSV